VVTEADGSAVHPQVLTRRFGAVVTPAGLPVIQLHDVRRSYATAALGAGVGVKMLCTTSAEPSDRSRMDVTASRRRPAR
jgi:hypothetical protein